MTAPARPRARRTPLLGALLMIGALVGMHHLVAVGCAAASVEHTSAQVSAHAVEQGGAHVVEHLELDTTSGDPAAMVLAPVPLTPADSGAMAACVAILIALWCAPPLARLASRAGHRHRADDAVAARPEEAAHPPDLAALSVSRT